MQRVYWYRFCFQRKQNRYRKLREVRRTEERFYGVIFALKDVEE